LIDLSGLIAKARDLEPLPASATRLAAVVARKEVDTQEVVSVVSLDQALTARLLRVANSVMSASLTPIKTVKQAVVRIGNATVLAIAVAGGVRRRMKESVPEYGMTEDSLWRHSVAAALATEEIKRRSVSPVPVEAFTAALLHDVGKLVLARFLAPEILTLVGRAQGEGGLTRLEAEAELLGVQHAELGGLIAQHWGLPEGIVGGVTYHHVPELGRSVVCDVVCVANEIAKGVRFAPVPQPLRAEDHAPVFARLGITPELLPELCAAVSNRFLAVLAQFE
jgi:HD-like signal output (HDOD) protein